MAKLKTLKPAIAMIRPLVLKVDRNSAEASRIRDATHEIRRNYKTARWRTLRWSVLIAAHFTCARCGWRHPKLSQLADLLVGTAAEKTISGSCPELVADHILPHRGDEEAFWDRLNLQCLCKSCHDGAKQAEERQAARHWP